MSSSSVVSTIPALDQLESLHAQMVRQRFPLHFHDTFVVELVLDGADVCGDHDTGLTAHQGQILLHTPYAVHDGGPLDRSPLEYQAIYPSARLVADLTGIPLDRIPNGKTVKCHGKREVRLLSRLLESLQQPVAPQHTVRLLSELMNRLIEHVVASREPSITPVDRLKETREYIIANSSDNVTTRTLSDVSGLSEFHLIRMFRKSWGMTPRQYVISQRVCEAKQMLSQRMSLVEVALQAGFSDQSHMTRCFKRVCGFNPGELCRALRRHAEAN